MAAASSARCFRESMRACGARPALPGRTRRLREDGSEKSVRLRCGWYVAEQLLRFEPCQLSLLNLCASLGRELFKGKDGRAKRRTTLRRRHCGVEVEDDGRALRHRMLGRAGGRGGSVRDPVRWRKSGMMRQWGARKQGGGHGAEHTGGVSGRSSSRRSGGIGTATAHACSKIISPRGDSRGKLCGVANTRGVSEMEDDGESRRMFSSEGARFKSVGDSTMRCRFLGSSRWSASASSAVRRRGTQ